MGLLLLLFQTQNPKPKTQTLKTPKPQNPTPKTQNPKPKIQNPKPKTPKPQKPKNPKSGKFADNFSSTHSSMKFRADSDSEIDSPPRPNPGILIFSIFQTCFQTRLGAFFVFRWPTFFWWP